MGANAPVTCAAGSWLLPVRTSIGGVGVGTPIRHSHPGTMPAPLRLPSKRESLIYRWYSQHDSQVTM